MLCRQMLNVLLGGAYSDVACTRRRGHVGAHHVRLNSDQPSLLSWAADSGSNPDRNPERNG